MVESLKELFTSASRELYGATRQRAFFKEVTILVPQGWSIEAETSVDETFEDAEFRLGPANPVYGHNPYTVQNRECGDPGEFTHLSSWFVLNHASNASTEFGRTDKVVVHEWAKLRWGVFEEFGYPAPLCNTALNVSKSSSFFGTRIRTYQPSDWPANKVVL